MKRVTLLVAVSSSVIALACSAQARAAPAADQPVDTSTDNVQPNSGEVIVTARRRAENLQDVPLSITAVSGAALEQRGVRDALDLQYQTPSLTVTANGASRSSVSYAIRGQRTNEVQLLTDPPVGTYFADVVEPRTYGFGTSFYDLQNVQILKGVQGTLFGRNMTGGAVLVEPNHPDFSGAHAEATAQYGNYNLRDVTGMINLPVIADTLAVRAAGTYRARDGFTTDVGSGRRYDDQNYYAFRVSSTLKIERFESYTVFDYVKESENGTALKLTGYALADPLNGKPTIIAQQIGASPFFPVAAGAPPQDLLTLFKRDIALPHYQVNFGGAGTGVLSGTAGLPFNTVKNWGITNKTTFQAGSVTFKNIFGYRKIDYVNHTDYDGGEAALILPTQATHTSNYSEEFQMQGTPFGSRFNLTAGAYFFQEEGRDGSVQSTFPQLTAIGFASNIPPLAGYFLTLPASAYNQSALATGLARSYAAYEAGTYTLTDQIKISGGIRYNNDLRRATVNPNYPNLVIPGLGGPGLCLYNGLGRFSAATCPHTNRLKNEAITWDATLQYEPTKDFNVYISTRRGYRSGGFNLRAQDDASFAPFQPETVQEYEAGLKNRFDLGGGARLNTSLAIYYQDYKNVQKQNATVVGTAIETIVTNTAQQHNYGGEAEANLTLPGGFAANVFYSYIKNKVVRGDNGTFAMQGVPTHQLGGGVTYNSTLEGIGELNANVNATYRSTTPLDDYDALLTQPGYTLVNGRIGINRVGGSGFGIAVFVNNLTNKYYILGGISLVSGGPLAAGPGFGAAVQGEPRTFGGEVSFRF